MEKVLEGWLLREVFATALAAPMRSSAARAALDLIGAARAVANTLQSEPKQLAEVK